MTESDRIGPAEAPAGPILSVNGAELAYGAHRLWTGLDLEVAVGEFVAVLGPNGSGKTSLMRAILGAQPLTRGSISFLGKEVRRGHSRIGYVPQQKLIEQGTPVRARDLVALGVNGSRWGLPLPRASVRRRVDAALGSVNASDLARAPMGSLSGGEQQRVRIGQALVCEPRLLLCDEPLSSLDLHHQREVSDLINRSRLERQLAVLMITHDVNPVLTMVDRVVYLAAGQVRIGTVDEVLTTAVLSELYQTRVEVFRTHGRVVVVGVPEDTQGHLDSGLHHDQPDRAGPHRGFDAGERFSQVRR